MSSDEFKRFYEDSVRRFTANPKLTRTSDGSMVCERELAGCDMFGAYDMRDPVDSRLVHLCTFDRGCLVNVDVIEWRDFSRQLGRASAFQKTKPEEKQPPTAQEISDAFNDLYQIGQSYFAVNTKDIKHAQGLALAQACDYLAELLRGAE